MTNKFRRAAAVALSALTAASVAVAATPAQARDVTRSCTARFELVHTDGGNYLMGEFTVRGTANRPNRARRRARDAAVRCMRAHHDLRAQAFEPSECTSAYGITDYPFASQVMGGRTLGDVMQQSFCAGRRGAQEPAARIRVRGDDGCMQIVVLSRWPINCG